MKPRRIVGLAFSLMIGASSASAATPLERVMAQLTQQGFEVTEMERTWLGRIKIEATNGEIKREIVFNRTSGEILRDIWRDLEDDDDDDSFEDSSDDDSEDDDD